MEQWMSWIPEIGFPVAVTFYLLHRVETKLDQLSECIFTLAEQLR
ncbi:hypothetical protein N781_03625 [Pontibacillus halophilus JSM 076056 = DSM 19796]|uniref:Uncharacterized protein n=1 Tax=Pontibacillus halophilus JSM 076056 = DSM 19796 TaxID=1385510 RepID=A0A0A5GKB2_9BACI|nr:YvrJ family protein [Pontibacillus halophilus]KGX91590.1 hypothetical protein N781_03625 [Pontibacillus halophilus JSM 076056 = DSM 19796]